MKKMFRFRTIVYIAVTLITVSAIALPCHFCGTEQLLDSFVDINYFDLLVGQVANTLIVLSLTSVLSSNFGQAYWVDIKDSKLVSPFWGCFIGITVYLLTGLVYSVVSYSIGFKSGMVISALGATILLVILTFKMISIYFGKEELKKRLSVEYRKLLILKNSNYVSDYLRRLKNFQKSISIDDFPKKHRFIAELKKEIIEIEADLNSGSKERADRCHKDHIAKWMNGREDVRSIDLKIEEFTKNAISNNDTEVVMENIELLVDSESYDAFFNLLEEVFEWDEKYACSTLKRISKKNQAWLVKDKMKYFKQYALSRLISQSGKFDALQNLLMIYDSSNMGMSKLDPEIRAITEECNENMEKKEELDHELDQKLKESNNLDNYRRCKREQLKKRKTIEEKDAALGKRLMELLNKATIKDLRTFYVPIQEAYLAYAEGKYEVTNKYLTVILENFELDRSEINYVLSLVSAYLEYTFSYVTEEEGRIIDLLIEKDKENMTIPEATKNRLSSLRQVVVNNNPSIAIGINTDTYDTFRSTMDFSRCDYKYNTHYHLRQSCQE